MSAPETPASEKPLHPLRIGTIILLAIILLSVALILNIRNTEGDAPSQSTSELRPNTSQDPHSAKSVTQGGDPNADTTPSQTGTGGNTQLNE